MVPAHELAVHARLSTHAVVTVTRILSVDRMGNEAEPDPHGNTLPLIFPLYTAPARVSVVLNLCPLIPPEVRTAPDDLDADGPRPLQTGRRYGRGGGTHYKDGGCGGTLAAAHRRHAVLVRGGWGEVGAPVRHDSSGDRADHLAVVQDQVPAGRRTRRRARPAERN